ncbi:hypothetical protein ACFFMP_04615 [Pseudoroseomonas cervicalis]|uniref:DUF883 domain-containing protein n=1 Tax=Pseudoroseomonas cervicalis ATCC 49957 TaxID=525371 RepID=D5RP39_9PROT|nr:DUF883 C-terminal domain-containing protein [Pseudoroseomonas cervicalis]EFH10930.1 hypothetical protein HMPREF0731_2850 [Pseudoroseomonas cervicalis ATCC 49957]WBV43283.1 DUF883 C-terminal domain-containing protein [Pseudoroseomonas cervicalis]
MRRLSQAIDTGSVEERLHDLRRKLDTLIEEQVNPALSRAGHQAQDMAQRAQGMAQRLGHDTRREAEQVMGVVRERPVATIAIAVGVGFLLAKLLRR